MTDYTKHIVFTMLLAGMLYTLLSLVFVKDTTLFYFGLLQAFLLGGAVRTGFFINDILIDDKNKRRYETKWI